MRSSLTDLFACAVLALFCLGAGPEIYKWVDDEGNVHYGDSPPANVEAELVHVESHPAGETDPSTSRLLQDAENRYRRLEQEREERTAARETEKQVRRDLDERCVYLRKQLISLQQRLPVYRDEDGKFRTVSQYDAYEGNREYLDDATRAREIERVTSEILIVCEKPGDRGEQFVASWHRRMEQRCDHARLKLTELQGDKRATRQAIRDAESEVDRYCDSDD